MGEGNGTPLQYSCLEKSHGGRSLVGCSPWGREESDTIERLPFHFSLSCIGEENGNPLQCSCLENPRDGGAWWAAVYGVAQSRTWLKWLSSSSSSQVHSHLRIFAIPFSCIMTLEIRLSLAILFFLGPHFPCYHIAIVSFPKAFNSIWG